MKTLDELNIEIKSRVNILAKAIIFYDNGKYLNSPETKEEKEFANNSFFIRRTRYSYWVLTVLELCKLFGKKGDHFTINKLLNKLLASHKTTPWRDKLSEEQIHNWQLKLGDQRTICNIDKLHGLRDQYYAHSDKEPEREIRELTPEYKEIEYLIDLSKEIIKEIQYKVFDIHQVFENIENQKANNILFNLLELKRLRVLELKLEREK